MEDDVPAAFDTHAGGLDMLLARATRLSLTCASAEGDEIRQGIAKVAASNLFMFVPIGFLIARAGQSCRAANCLIPAFAGAISTPESRDAPWARFTTGAP